MKLDIAVERDEAGFYVVVVPAFRGCLSQGKTRKEAIKNIHEAIAGWLEVMEGERKGCEA